MKKIEVIFQMSFPSSNICYSGIASALKCSLQICIVNARLTNDPSGSAIKKEDICKSVVVSL